jgi:HK97 family phage portal protein
MSNPEPVLYDDWSEFLAQLINSLYLRGESIVYALARYREGEQRGHVARMAVLNPDHVNIEWADGAVRYEVGGKEIPSADIWHHKYQSWPGNVRGVTPLTWIGRNLLSADSMERYQAQLASQGGVPWAVLTAPGNLTREQADANRQSWQEASTRRGTAPVMLGGGLTLDTLTLSPSDMALLELRVFDEQRICAAMTVPPYLVGLPQAEGFTYVNATALFDYFWRSSLRPLTRSLAAGLSRWALPVPQRIEFNADEFTRPDFAGRADAYATLFALVDEQGNRALTIDEIRQAERFGTDNVQATSGASLSGPTLPSAVGAP